MATEASGLHIASVAFKVICHLKFDASNPYYPSIDVHITWNSRYGGL